MIETGSDPIKVNQPKIFVISGPAGVGKGTIIRALLKDQSLKVAWSKSFTTRSKRLSDAKEDHYFFVDPNQFKKLERSGEILESNFYNNHWYGSSKSDLESHLAAGRNIIKEIEVSGGLAFLKQYPDRSVLIFLTAPIEDIKKRLEARGQNTTQEIEQRLRIAKRELAVARQYYDQIVENPQGKPVQAIERVKKIVLLENARTFDIARVRWKDGLNGQSKKTV